MTTIFQDCKKLRNSDPSEQELAKFYQKRDDYVKTAKKLSHHVDDFLEISTISWPAKWQVDENTPKLNGKGKYHFPNLDL